MELWTLVFVILGFSFSLCSILVDSQDNVNVPSQPSVVTTPLPPPPPPSPSPPPLSQPPPPPQTPSPPPPSPLHGRPPPPPKPRTRRPNSLPHSKKNATMSPQSNHNLHNEAVSRDKHGGKKAQHEHITSGKKVGLLFIGVAGVLQICVAGFLIFKWQQLIAKDQG